ncbi:hypothetical protein CT19425_U460010 [Cupriavidus taiwanensis]|uniref:Uncharacterized protein n=1 Tax=Cupriavidus taiwanensis TaxID=164546 RepID=A0A375I8R8_9BURK|nr:hypothetical protein CT19425_U460010 [Cupriavidus taiwanensis]
MDSWVGNGRPPIAARNIAHNKCWCKECARRLRELTLGFCSLNLIDSKRVEFDSPFSVTSKDLVSYAKMHFGETSGSEKHLGR